MSRVYCTKQIIASVYAIVNAVSAFPFYWKQENYCQTHHFVTKNNDITAPRHIFPTQDVFTLRFCFYKKQKHTALSLFRRFTSLFLINFYVNTESELNSQNRIFSYKYKQYLKPRQKLADTGNVQTWPDKYCIV